MGYTSDFEIQHPFCQPLDPCLKISLHSNKFIRFSNPLKYRIDLKVSLKDVPARLQDDHLPSAYSCLQHRQILNNYIFREFSGRGEY